MQHVAQQALGGVSRVGTAAEVSTSKLWLGPPTKKRACVCGENGGWWPGQCLMPHGGGKNAPTRKLVNLPSL